MLSVIDLVLLDVKNVRRSVLSKITNRSVHHDNKIHKRVLYFASKRAFDFLLALVACIVLFIPMLIVMAIIKIESPGPAIFKQQRMGKDGKSFTIYKLRSMRLNAPSEMATRDFVDSKSYITKFGAFIRRTSIDELPQLLNILNGSMSFVGYRPVCLTELELNRLRKELGVFSMKPGLTGLAQIRGRDNLTVQEKARIDAEYVDKCGFFFDLRCLFETVGVVLTGKGVR